MKPALRLFAAIKPTRFLEPNAPTGITGLLTHPAPRSALLYLYSATLDKLRTIPESSAYRQSTEALTRHRLEIVEAIKPEGWDTWQEKARKKVEENPKAFKAVTFGAGSDSEKTGFVSLKFGEVPDERDEEWDGEDIDASREGAMTDKDELFQRLRRPGPGEGNDFKTDNDNDTYQLYLDQKAGRDESTVTWDPEPNLSADQIIELENNIGAGLIEEVIQVAEGELELADEMIKSKVWEDLEEKPVKGQWAYFERGAH
ncbi:MAG: hypothetical protein M1834_006673 [Cirrosporium novae-zelandiae]|nr:MAG: hypothetical protein M1834_006673 [Cirrosporium novae-zelandiae]